MWGRRGEGGGEVRRNEDEFVMEIVVSAKWERVIYAHTRTHTHTHTDAHTHTLMHTHTNILKPVQTLMNTHTYSRTQICTNIEIHPEHMHTIENGTCIKKSIQGSKPSGFLPYTHIIFLYNVS